jgi:hypothetical protein
VNKTIPDYLKLFRASSESAAQSSISNKLEISEPVVRPHVGRDAKIAEAIDAFWPAFTSATGWKLDSRARRKGEVQMVPALSMDGLMSADSMEDQPLTSERDARTLAKVALSLSEELKSARRSLRRQAAELAARAAVIVTPSQRDDLAGYIEQLLDQALLATRCDTAAVYLLDDDTRSLALRFAHGLAQQKLAAEPRPLRGSRGDLEALIQGVVMIDDLKLGPIDTWNCPEPAEAAVCACLSLDDTPIGTMWLFSDEKQSFNEQTVGAVRLAASGIVQKLSHQRTATVSYSQLEGKPHIRDIAAWQYRGLPAATELVHRWPIDGMLESPNEWSIGWHAWDVLPDGSLYVAFAEAEDESVTGAMVAALTRGALTAHVGYRHTPAQLVQRVSDSLWQSNTGDQLVSLLYAVIDPETGAGEIATAGHVASIIASRYGYRPVVGDSHPPLGTLIDPLFSVNSIKMSPGESLLVYGKGWGNNAQMQLVMGEALRDSFLDKQFNPLATIRRKRASTKPERERGAIALSWT